MRHPGIEPGPPRWQRGIITTRLMTPISYNKRGQGGIEPPTSRTRSENHATRPLTRIAMPTKGILDPGIEPGTYCVLGSRHNQLDQPSIKLLSILGGTRTLNLEIRSLTPYPVRPRGLMLVKQKGMPRVGFEPTHSFEYLNLSQAP